jgi:hypothetical protein
MYPWPSVEPHEFVAPSVTTILGGGIPKKLHYWSAKQVARFAIDHKKSWENLPDRAAFELLKEAPWRYRDEKGEVGDAVHDAIEAFANGEPMPEFKDARARGCAAAAVKFLEAHPHEVLHTEVTIYSRKYCYAGSTDRIILYDFRDGRGPVPTVLDWKTSNNLYDDVALQLVAYARGDFIADEDSDDELVLPKIEDGIAVHLKPDGKFTAIPFALDDALFNLFLEAKGVANREKTLKTSRRRALPQKWKEAA